MHHELFVYLAHYVNPIGGFEPVVPVKWLHWFCEMGARYIYPCARPF